MNNLLNKRKGYRCSLFMLYETGKVTSSQKTSAISREMTSPTLMLLTSAHKNQASLFPKIIRSNSGSHSWYCKCHTHKPMHSTALDKIIVSKHLCLVLYSVYTLITITIFSAHLSSYHFCDILVSLVSLTHVRQSNTSGSLCVRLDVLLNLCTCVFVCVRVVCVAVPIVRWRSVRCAAVRRPLSSSLLALSQASRQPPEMQDSVLGKEILVLLPTRPLLPLFLLLRPTSTTHPPATPSCYPCSENTTTFSH